jgi:DNA-binding CsgD family transcriptional regulator
MAANWPLVGRQEELNLIAEALAQLQRAGVVVAGGSGVGKTRLTTEALNQAGAQGWVTEWVIATHAASSIPFGAFAHVLPPTMPPTSSRLAVLREAYTALATRAEGRRFALAVDDAHLLDNSSAVLVHQLATTRAVFLVATVRTGTRAPDAIVALWKEGHADRLELQPLALEEVSDLLARVLGGHVESSSSDRLWQLSQGNVLFLTELISSGLETGSLVSSGGMWRWRGKPAAPRLVELVGSSLGRLTGEQRALLELVALGEPVEAAVVGQVVGQGTIDEAERKSLVTVVQEDRRRLVRLAHPLYGEVLRAQIPALRAAQVRRRLAEAVEATGARRRGDLLRVASWRLDADGSGPPDLMLRASLEAQAAGEPLLAERLARASLRAGGGVHAGLVLVYCMSRNGHHAEALGVLEGLEAEAGASAAWPTLAEAHAYVLAWGLGRPAEAVRVLEAAESAAASQDLRDELAALRAAILLYSASPGEALAVASQILARPAVSERAAGRALLAAAPAEASTGRPDSAVAAIDAGLARAARLRSEVPFIEYQALLQRSTILRMGGRIQEAASSAAQGHQAASAQHAADVVGYWCMALGQAALSRGQMRTSLRWLKEAAELLAENDPIQLRPWSSASLAQAAALASELRLAEAALVEAETACPPWLTMYRPELRQARIWLLAARGELSNARHLAVEAASEAHGRGQLGFEVNLLHDLVRLGDPGQAKPRLRSLAQIVEGQMPAAYARHAQALTRRDATALDRASAEFESLGAILLAAEAAVEASSAHQEAGRRPRSVASAARGEALKDACEGARTPVLSSPSQLVVLTGREREVAALAASGLPNRDIAVRLSMSVRTVENHLRHVYDKAGISRRSELEPFLSVPVTGQSNVQSFRDVAAHWG